MTYNSINDEWAKFMTNSNSTDEEEEDDIAESEDKLQFDSDNEEILSHLAFDYNSETPKATDIYISTKTKLGYLNQQFDLNTIFWKIPVMPYATPNNGVIKKQRKFNSSTIEELNDIQEKIANEIYFEEHIITNINNPTGRIKFKDIRKISIGISKKDIMSYRCKKKSAFYNCFVIIIRILIEQNYKEFHVKIFNTGKIEIPGIQSEVTFKLIIQLVIDLLQPHVSEKLEYNIENEETVLINSNFNCGFFINRETLCDILKYKYDIQCIYDPCSYPGIQCKFYFNPDLDIDNQSGSQISEENKKKYKNIKQVSFMIFRTGSVLIVGRCDESILMIIYNYIKIVLNNEYKNIHQKIVKLTNEPDVEIKNKDKKKKIRRKNIIINL
jgi:hypothetical protein